VFSSGESHASASKAIALTLRISGKVMLRKTGNKKAVPLKFGTPLDDGDWIGTGNDGSVTIVFADDKSQIKIRPNTEIVINGKRDKRSNIAKRISMDIGKIYAKVTKQQCTFEIATPTSVASVKGTEFWMLVSENGLTEVLTMEGLVELLNKISGKVVEVSSGNKGTSDSQGGSTVTPSAPEEIPEDPEKDVNIPERIEIEVQDKDGRSRTIIIQYTEESK